jgi:hypothetical protein
MPEKYKRTTPPAEIECPTLRTSISTVAAMNLPVVTARFDKVLLSLLASFRFVENDDRSTAFVVHPTRLTRKTWKRK